MKLKDKKIEILAQVTERDSEGFSTTTLQPVDAPVWAYFRQLSGKEVFAAATTNYKEEVLFTIKLPHGHTPCPCRAVQGRPV